MIEEEFFEFLIFISGSAVFVALLLFFLLKAWGK